MFHDLNLTGNRRDVYSLPSESFANSMRELASWTMLNAVPFVPFTDHPEHGVAVTFDDGYRSTSVLAQQTLASLSIPFHVFVTKNYVLSNDPQYLTVNDLRLLAEHPLVTIGTHGITHTKFTELSTTALLGELRESRTWLEDVIGKPVLSLSYPHGEYNEKVLDLVQESGYTHAACSNIGTFGDPIQRFAIPRIDIWALDSGGAILNKVRGNWDFLLR